MESDNKNYLLFLTSIWIAFVVMLKLIEHQRAFNKVELGFRFDLCILFPALLIYTIKVLAKHRNDFFDDEN